MCIEFAFKKAGIPIIRNFMHGCEGVLGGIPAASRARYGVHFRVKEMVGGKPKGHSYYVDSVLDAFPAKGDK